jgi:hypothetical protein
MVLGLGKDNAADETRGHSPRRVWKRSSLQCDRKDCGKLFAMEENLNKYYSHDHSEAKRIGLSFHIGDSPKPLYVIKEKRRWFKGDSQLAKQMNNHHKVKN